MRITSQFLTSAYSARRIFFWCFNTDGKKWNLTMSLSNRVKLTFHRYVFQFAGPNMYTRRPSAINLYATKHARVALRTCQKMKQDTSGADQKCCCCSLAADSTETICRTNWYFYICCWHRLMNSKWVCLVWARKKIISSSQSGSLMRLLLYGRECAAKSVPESRLRVTI